ncbi:MAG: trypsin-like peptidase domain-containing protein [Chloroflexi bacterium]|nr:trypsin-like peptidase domain-containing protein [Chloroflexota bacterium]
MKRLDIKTLAVCLVLISSLLLGAGCDLLPTVTTPPPTTPAPAANVTETTAEKPVTPAPGPTTTIPTSPLLPIASTPAPPLPSIADVVARVKPSVVAINTEVTLLDFFNRPRSEEGAGSGLIIREDGLIITNNHVVQNARTISVTLDDGRTFPVDLATVKTDTLTDLAILKINASSLPAAQVGDSSRMRVGDWVVAIGNALGEGIRATQGIISRQNASLNVDSTEILYGLIETDAAINPGNSGGPLVNMAGEVIGITNAKLAAVGIEATGFAISTETAVPVIQQLITAGRAVHPWLGVSLVPIDQVLIQEFNLAADKGAFVAQVVSDSPAGVAGLQPEDVIVSFAGKEVTSVAGLITAIRQSQVGQKVEIVYWRGKTKNTATTTLVERPQ